MINISQLYAAIDQKRQSEGRSWRQLAAHIGVSPSTLSRMGAGGKPDVDSFAVIIGWLGIPAERFFAVPQADPPNTLAMVSAALRADPRLSDQSAEALERIVLAAYHALSGVP